MIKLQERLREPIKLINDPPWYVRYLNGTQEGLLIREREEAADALDAAEAEIARLKEAVTDLGADVLRLHKEKCDLLCPETATQPPAVGEDVVEQAKKIANEPEPECCGNVVQDAHDEPPYCCGSPDPRPKTPDEVVEALAVSNLLRTKDAG